jgi:hypothetical protein
MAALTVLQEAIGIVRSWEELGCALTFASEAKFEIEVKISIRLEAKKMPDFT